MVYFLPLYALVCQGSHPHHPRLLPRPQDAVLAVRTLSLPVPPARPFRHPAFPRVLPWSCCAGLGFALPLRSCAEGLRVIIAAGTRMPVPPAVAAEWPAVVLARGTQQPRHFVPRTHRSRTPVGTCRGARSTRRCTAAVAARRNTAAAAPRSTVVPRTARLLVGRHGSRTLLERARLRRGVPSRQSQTSALSKAPRHPRRPAAERPRNWDRTYCCRAAQDRRLVTRHYSPARRDPPRLAAVFRAAPAVGLEPRTDRWLRVFALMSALTTATRPLSPLPFPALSPLARAA
mmetsp:Transcript_7380/g.17735  ORF Transcript_7380/g.17735 Transcript_7380/m.17735 type:complete len:289 (+) Transcript_7380:232-1098(+)